MLIYLGDLAYFHKWDNIQPIPLNVGYIASYLKDKHPEISIEIFKRPKKIMDRISERAPDILALSHYEWNSNLNLAVLKHMKQKNENTITVMGGPSFQPYDTKWIDKFFQKRPNLDAYITNEGEWSFNRFVELLEKHGKKLLNIPFEQLPSTLFYMNKKSKTVINNPKNFVKRLDLTNHPSPYLTGILDDFLKDPRLAPVIETNRGCPYECTFCNWGNAIKSDINQFSLETVKNEMEYVAKNTKNTRGFFYVGDANFGILRRDEEIANVVNECSKKYDFPRHIYIYFAKNANETIVNIASTLKTVTMMNLSRQTMNKDVLDYIKRDNISTEMFDDLQQKCYEKGIETFCELIYALPGETYQSFIDGVIETCNTGVDIALFPQTMLLGAEASTKPYREKYGLKSAFRVIPRYINDDDALPVLEYEEVVVETDYLSREDFWNIRLFYFIFTIFRSEIFIELAHALAINGSNHAALANLIVQDKKNWAPKVKKLFDDFRQSAKDEFIEEHEKIIDFTLEDIKIARIRNKALNPLYQSRIACDMKLISELKSYLLKSIDRFFKREKNSVNLNELKQTVRFGFDKLANYEKLESGKILSYNYDITSWLDDPNRSPLEKFFIPEPIKYIFKFDDDILLNLEKLEVSYDTSLSDSVYRLRANEMGPTGDRIFCYKRVELSSGSLESNRISKREAIRHHVEIAARKS